MKINEETIVDVIDPSVVTLVLKANGSARLHVNVDGICVCRCFNIKVLHVIHEHPPSVEKLEQNLNN